MKVLMYLLSILFCTVLFSQDPKLSVKKEGKQIVFYCENASEFDEELTLTLKNIKGLKGYKRPITKLIPAKSIKPIISLQVVGRKIDYKATASSKRLKNYDKELSKLDNGIVLFYTKTCSRCKFADSYFREQNISYKKIDISNSSEKKALMFASIKREGYTTTQLTTPVILVNGKVNFNIKDLPNFLRSLH